MDKATKRKFWTIWRHLVPGAVQKLSCLWLCNPSCRSSAPGTSPTSNRDDMIERKSYQQYPLTDTSQNNSRKIRNRRRRRNPRTSKWIRNTLHKRFRQRNTFEGTIQEWRVTNRNFWHSRCLESSTPTESTTIDKSCPLQFYQTYENILPNLSEIAKLVFCTTASSVPSECTFSQAGLLINKKRSRLSPAIAEDLLFLKIN